MKRFLKIIAWIIASLALVLIALIVYVRSVASVTDPVLSISSGNLKVVQVGPGLRKLGNNWFRKSESGLYELYVEGSPAERGLAIGKLTEELIRYQEEVFNAQIHQLVPSDVYLNVLKYFVGWFNRDLDDHVAQEFREEIYGVSRVASHEFDDIAPPYQRMLNYHAAHDIGHALQNMSLVGCTAFATWSDRSEDSTLIIGRNFDFYVGDDFAENKIVAFYSPEKGHRFMVITFGGMTGVLSGMNDAGLTVTLNAAKSKIPTASATPVSILAREILQYASTIDEAFEIAKSRKTFVAEAFMIGSAKDNRAAIIEKSPDAIDLYESGENSIIGTNHYQSKTLGNTQLNQEHIQKSASEYRFRRVKELLDRGGKNSVRKTANILRNQKGLNDRSIGMGNEKAVNQLIAHHGIIFQPAKKRVWISASTWQLGEFVCYHLDSVFASAMDSSNEIYQKDLTLPADSFLLTKEFQNALKFNAFRFPFQPRGEVHPDSLMQWNPDSYLSYMLAGDYYLEQKEFAKAREIYQTGLTKEIATEQEREHMKENLETCEHRLK